MQYYTYNNNEKAIVVEDHAPMICTPTRFSFLKVLSGYVPDEEIRSALQTYIRLLISNEQDMCQGLLDFFDSIKKQFTEPDDKTTDNIENIYMYNMYREGTNFKLIEYEYPVDKVTEKMVYLQKAHYGKKVFRKDEFYSDEQTWRSYRKNSSELGNIILQDRYERLYKKSIQKIMFWSELLENTNNIKIIYNI